MFAKALHRCARLGIDGIKPAQTAAEHDRGGVALRALPVSHAPRRGDVRVGQLVFPQLGARGGVERDDLAIAGRDIHDVAHHDRNGFHQPRAAGIANRGHVIGPGDLKTGDIILVDLGQRRIALATQIMTAGLPIGARRHGRCREQAQCRAHSARRFRRSTGPALEERLALQQCFHCTPLISVIT